MDLGALGFDPPPSPRPTSDLPKGQEGHLQEEAALFRVVPRGLNSKSPGHCRIWLAEGQSESRRESGVPHQRAGRTCPV